MGAGSSFYKIDIESAEIVDNDDVYSIKIQTSTREPIVWTLKKSFREFNDFSELIWKKFPKIPDLPSKTLAKAKSS
jgi:hypothetical protein